MTLKLLHIKLITVLIALTFGALLQTIHAQDNVAQKELTSYFAEARKYKNKNQIDLALELLNKASKEAKEKEDVKALIDSYHEFAILYLKLDKEDTAEFYLDRAKLLLKDTEYPYGNAIYEYIGAKLLYKRGNDYQAIYILDKAEQLNNNRNFINNKLLLEGNIYVSLGKYDIASKNFNSLIVNTDIYEKNYLTTQAYLGLTKLNYKIEKYAESSTNAENALKIAEKNGFYKEILKANEELTKIYEAIGQYDIALKHNRNLIKIKDTLFNIEKIKSEATAAKNIDIDFKTDLIKQQDLTIEELNESKNKSELTAILASAFLIIISLLAVSLFRNNHIKLKTNDLLQTKNNELQLAKDAAVSAMEAKTNFLSTVSHELRTPLYAVTGLTHLLLEESPNENQKEHLKSLKFSGDYLLNFINDILQINKIDADKLETLIIDFNLKRTLKEVINSLQQSAKENNTTIILEYDNEIPSHLMSDPIKLSQIFINLVGNALKFTKNGEVNVIAKLIKKEDENVKLYFEVKDNGIGISEENQQSVFEGFEQGSIQINREYGGTGLGLTIVKSLLGLFNTRIQLKSELGKGSSFFFQIDVKCKDSLIDDTLFEITEKEYDFKGLHILIVEDNKINQVITKKMLAKKEISSDIANNGYEAVELAKKNTYDAILMDIHMPGISGEEATIQIRKFNTKIPIIALTAISLDDSLESFYAAGCSDVVTKPFKPEVFYRKIGENIFGL